MILLTGGSGLLGSELSKRIKCYSPTRNIFDILNLGIHYCSTSELMTHCENINECKLIIHCAAYTDVAMAETEKELCYQTNVIGTRNLSSLGIPMVYISTEYVFDGEKGNYSEEDYPNPRNFYALTKLLGEYEALKNPKNRVVRCLFKPSPFEHAAACVDQWTTGGYVDDMADEITLAIRNWIDLPPIIHIGFTRRSTYELARETREVIPITRESIGAVRIPRDTSLNTSKWEELKCRWTSHDQSMVNQK